MIFSRYFYTLERHHHMKTGKSSHARSPCSYGKMGGAPITNREGFKGPGNDELRLPENSDSHPENITKNARPHTSSRLCGIRASKKYGSWSYFNHLSKSLSRSPLNLASFHKKFITFRKSGSSCWMKKPMKLIFVKGLSVNAPYNLSSFRE